MPSVECVLHGAMAGGMSGLYHALTGAHLPGGRLEATAEGNALGKGPVVFEVHQSAVEIIRRLAARKSPALQVAEACKQSWTPLSGD